MRHANAFVERQSSSAPARQSQPRRKCSCGGTHDGECEECRKKRGAHEGHGGHGRATSPDAVRELTRSHFGRIAVLPGRGGNGAGDDETARPAPETTAAPLADAAEAAPAAPATCVPSRSLTWSDFTGSPPSSSTYSAYTAYDFATVSATGGAYIQASFAAGRSWVRARWATPSDRALNGCAAITTDCEQYFPEGSTGGEYTLPSAPSATCPASIRPAADTRATAKGECTSVIETECTRVAQAESARLLAHEQGHLALACALAQKGTDAIRAGTLTADQALAQVRHTDTVVTPLYDSASETNHGCNGSKQSDWDTEIAAGLPSHNLRAPPPPRRRRRR